MTRRSFSTSVEFDVEVELCDIDDEHLIEEIESRGFSVVAGRNVDDAWAKLADAYHFGREPERVLADLIYENTGRIVEPRKH